MLKLNSLIAIFTICLSTALQAQQVMRLYDGAAPGSETWNWEEKIAPPDAFNNRNVYNVTTPTLTAYLPKPEIATGTAVIIAPGGGFHFLAFDNEGIKIAEYLASKGVAAFVLKYRLVKCLTDDPSKEFRDKMATPLKYREDVTPIIPLELQDGLAAVKYVRSHAQEMDIDTGRIGFMGFSAGGTVAMSVVYSATEESHPNFIAPIYAYVAGAIGSNVPTAPTPAFIAVATDDQLNLTSQSVDVYNKWKAAKQSVELHVFARGGHGFGMKKLKLPSDTWYERFGEWMKMQGYLKKLHPSDYELKNGEEAATEYFKNQEERKKMDWASLNKYKEDNSKVGLPQAGENRVVLLGNSITEGWVRDQPEFFTNGKIGRGISGQTSPQTLVRFRQDVLDLKPKVVVINIGINDVAENTGPYDPNFTFGNIKSMSELARANNIKVILASVHPCDEFPWRKEVKDVANKIIQLNAMIQAYTQENNLIYLDYHTAMKNERNGMNKELAGDGVHPTHAGFQMMALLADTAIQEALK